MDQDTWEFSYENTRVIIVPKKRIATFADTTIYYTLLTADMDNPYLTHLREGSLTAEKPQILSPHNFATLLLKGFGQEAQQYAQSIREALSQSVFLKYGFLIKKTEIRTHTLHDPIEVCLPKIEAEIRNLDNPLHTLITGLDKGWEVALIKFILTYIHYSAQHNLENFQQRGLL
jgi:hypothetical protein